jgi:hypothetical protein
MSSYHLSRFTPRCNEATRKRTLTTAEVAEIERRVGAWRDMTVIPWVE